MSNEDLWETRKLSAKTVLRQFADEHTAESQHAKLRVIYMDAAPVSSDVHPAVAIAERTVLAISKHDALFHQAQAQQVNRAIEAIEALTQEKDN